MRRYFITILIVITTILLFTTAAAYANTSAKVVVDTSSIDSGVIKVSYASESNKITKLMIEKGDKKYTYPLKTDGTSESFPLQMGNGDYNVTLLENISGTKYAVIHKETVKVNISDQNKVFLSSVQNINWAETMKAVKKAKELTKNVKAEKDKIALIYNYVVTNYKYDYTKVGNLQSDYIPVIDKTLEEGKGICYDYSSLFASMLRSVGIPVRLVKGYTDNVEGYHAWNEVYMSDTKKWVPVDSTFDSQMKAANKKFSMIKSATLYKLVNLY